MKTGDRVVCVRSHSQSEINGVVKGREFIILDLIKLSCGCIAVRVNNTPLPPNVNIKCLVHGSEYITDGYWWTYASRFAPIQTKSEFISSDEFTTIEETIDVPIPQETE